MPAPARMLFLGWALYTSYVFLHAGALAHDEMEFVALAKSISFWDFVSKAPPAFYGSLFWVSLKLASGAMVARLIVLAMMVLTPYVLMRALPDQRARMLLLAAWLTFPIAWWTGKLIAPEIPSMFLVALALLWYGRGRARASALALGLAAALKISSVPAVVFFATLCLLQGSGTWGAKLRQLCIMGAVFVLVLVVGFPSIADSLQHLAQQQPPAPLPLAELLERALMTDRWEWDAVFSGGVLAFSMAAIPLVLAMLSALTVNWRISLAALLAGLAFLFLSVRSASYYGWYWIAFFPILLFTLAQLPSIGRPLLRRAVTACLVLAVGINAVLQLPLICDQVYQKAEQIRLLRNRHAIEACIEQVIAQRQPRDIYNSAEFGLTLNTKVPVYVWPGPQSEGAEMILMGTRTLVSKRFPVSGWTAPPLVATCDAVLIFSKK